MTTRSRRAFGVALLAVGSLFLAPATALGQCAMCRSAFASPEGRQLAEAFRAGIVFLLVAPFASFVTVAVLAVRRQRRRDATPRAQD